MLSASHSYSNRLLKCTFLSSLWDGIKSTSEVSNVHHAISYFLHLYCLKNDYRLKNDTDSRLLFAVSLPAVKRPVLVILRAGGISCNCNYLKLQKKSRYLRCLRIVKKNSCLSLSDNDL